MSESILTRARPLLVARLAGALLTLAVPMVLARVLVPASYGTFKQAWLLAQTVALVLPMGMTMSLYYFVPREPGERDAHVAQALWFHLVLGIAAAALLLLCAPLVDRQFHNPELSRNLRWVAAFTGLQIIGAPLDIAWNASGRIGAAAVARLLTEVARGAAILAAALVGGSVEAVFVGITAAHLLRAAWTFAALGRAHGLRPSLPALRRQAAYALPFGAAFLLIVPQQQLHHYVVAGAVSAAAFAVYSVGTFQLPVVDILYTPVSELLQIGLAEVEGAGRPPRAGLPLFHEAVQQLAFAFLPLMGLLGVIAPALIELLFSARYLEAVPIFRLGILSVALAALPLDGVMRARAQTGYMVALSAAKLAATVPLVVGGLRAAGPIGALGGWIVAETLARALMLHRAARLFEVPLARILPVRALARQLAATGVGMAPAWLVVRGLEAPVVLRVAAACLAFAAAYLGLSWARGWLPAGWISLFATRRARTVAAPSEP